MMCVVFKPEQLSSDSTPVNVFSLPFFFFYWNIVALQCWVGMYFLMLIAYSSSWVFISFFLPAQRFFTLDLLERD